MSRLSYAKLLSVSALGVLLSGCELFSSREAPPEIDPNTFAAMQPAVVNVQSVGTEQAVSVQDVIQSYEALLPLVKDDELKVSVQHRLADLNLERGEVLLAEQSVDDMGVAIDAYNALLTAHPQRAGNDHILYQLSKAYDLKGMRNEHMLTLERIADGYPQSPHWVEVQFRRGEILFGEGDYFAAQQAFEAVISREDPNFQANAHYMRGWSLFKQGLYAEALPAFSRVLDLQIPSEQEMTDLQTPYGTLIEDVLRVMGLSFSHLDRAQSVGTLFNMVGARNYEILVYDRYAKLLLEKEQYSDAIDTWRGFIARQPLNRWAAQYQLQIIATLQKAKFQQEVPAEKLRFVDTYGLNSEWWKAQSPDSIELVKPHLETLLPELANRHYVLGQQAQKQKNGQAMEHFTRASKYYTAFVDTFPQHENTPEMIFLLAESQLAMQNWLAAIEAFSRAGYDFFGYQRGSEAAYAVLSAWQSYAETWQGLSPEQVTALQEQRQAARLRFVLTYPEDARAVEVLYIATQYEYEKLNYEETIKRAQQLLEWRPAVTPTIALEARLLKAHSLYALEYYDLAEAAYAQVLQVMPTKDKRYQGLTENLAACVYKQGELALKSGDKGGAVEQFLRVGSVAPTSTIRANAEYDAASYLIEMKQWPEAIRVMTAFRARYPEHKLIDTLPAKLALSYRESEQWTLAADELKHMFALAKTDEEKRDTLYIAAELYDRANNQAQAIETYRDYVGRYAEPADVWMEAINRLAELSELKKDPVQRRVWLGKLIQRVDAAPATADDRMRFLAAQAAAVFADDAYQAYRAIQLKLPLDQSLAQKTKALEASMQAYQKVAGYGISAFSTEAGFRMAEIYAGLSQDLMASDRPEGLSELELEQYDILLEEQAFPFEESAIGIHEQNASRAWNDIYDEWVKRSFESLKKLLPGRYDKPEAGWDIVDDLGDKP